MSRGEHVRAKRTRYLFRDLFCVFLRLVTKTMMLRTLVVAECVQYLLTSHFVLSLASWSTMSAQS